MVFESVQRFFNLRRAKKSLKLIEKLFVKKNKHLDLIARSAIEQNISSLKLAISEKNITIVKDKIHLLEELAEVYMKRSMFEKIRESFGAIIVALAIATVVRCMWFELYTIPTGSMRPTLKESDFLVVSKTDFGLNVPLQASHFFFDPTLVNRGSVVVWTGKNMDIADSDTVYFYLFPGKKQFVKRLIGKPGDTLYFYGGKIYGIDQEGREILDFQQASCFQDLEHIPFIHLEGKVDAFDLKSGGVFSKATFAHMGQTIAKMHSNPFGFVSGDTLANSNSEKLKHFSDYFGMGNYAMARLLSPDECKELHPKFFASHSNHLLYLELTHHPSVISGKMISDEQNRIRPDVGLSVSLLGLEKDHIDRISEHMTTCRFVVKNAKAFRLGMDSEAPYLTKYFPSFPELEDGTYEILDGQGYKVYPMGYTVKLPKSHPIHSKKPIHVYKMYNLGIELLTQYLPRKNTKAHPSRYAYFRDGNLMLLASPIVFKEDPSLQAFVSFEEEREKIATSSQPYLPFKDAGAPILPSGELDREKILKCGLKIPDKHYLMLGDNHAMSADSRVFGFVPESNLKGTARFLFSPPGERFGTLSQPDKNHFAYPNVVIWTLFLSSCALYLRFRNAKYLEALKNQFKNFAWKR